MEGAGAGGFDQHGPPVGACQPFGLLPALFAPAAPATRARPAPFVVTLGRMPLGIAGTPQSTKTMKLISGRCQVGTTSTGSIGIAAVLLLCA